MKNISIGQAQRLTAPAPFGLLSVRRNDGGTNLMAVSWWTYLSNHPPMLGVCLSKKGLSGSLITESGEFALSIVGENLREAALNCGLLRTGYGQGGPVRHPSCARVRNRNPGGGGQPGGI